MDDYKTRMEQEVALFTSFCMPRNTYEAKKEAFLTALDEPYEEKEEF